MTTTRSRRAISRRALLIVIAVSALCTWGGLLLFTYYVQPQGAATIVVFLLLSIALYCTCTLLIYSISWAVLATRARRPSLAQALRESGLTTAWLIFNLLLSALHSWSIFSTVVSFGIIVVAELLVLAR
jgi:hypothetical protein